MALPAFTELLRRRWRTLPKPSQMSQALFSGLRVCRYGFDLRFSASLSFGYTCVVIYGSVRDSSFGLACGGMITVSITYLLIGFDGLRAMGWGLLITVLQQIMCVRVRVRLGAGAQ